MNLNENQRTFFSNCLIPIVVSTALVIAIYLSKGFVPCAAIYLVIGWIIIFVIIKSAYKPKVKLENAQSKLIITQDKTEKEILKKQRADKNERIFFYFFYSDYYHSALFNRMGNNPRFRFINVSQY